MKKILIIACLLFLYQENKSQNVYTMSAGESIFSLSSFDAGNYDVKPILRWAPFFNYQQQLHVDFSKSAGLYSGIGVRNVGFINRISETDTDYTVKERSYALAFPLVFTFGNLQDGPSIGIGGEAEFMVAWKRKVILDGKKIDKPHEWFSDETSPINPSLLLELKFHKRQYIRVKYYLADFLQYRGGLQVPEGPLLTGYPKGSKLFYFSFGSTVFKKKLGKQNEEKPSGTKT